MFYSIIFSRFVCFHYMVLLLLICDSYMSIHWQSLDTLNYSFLSMVNAHTNTCDNHFSFFDKRNQKFQNNACSLSKGKYSECWDFFIELIVINYRRHTNAGIPNYLVCQNYYQFNQNLKLNSIYRGWSVFWWANIIINHLFVCLLLFEHFVSIFNELKMNITLQKAENKPMKCIRTNSIRKTKNQLKKTMKMKTTK